jgi:hypothetical protein
MLYIRAGMVHITAWSNKRDIREARGILKKLGQVMLAHLQCKSRSEKKLDMLCNSGFDQDSNKYFTQPC